MNTMKMITLTAAIALATCFAEAKTLIAKDLTPQTWSDIASGKLQDITIEFRSGDELPLSFVAEGDFFQTKDPGVNYIQIKKSFWVKPDIAHSQILVSLDGVTFKPLTEVMTGSFQVGAGSDDNNSGVAKGIQTVLRADLRK